MALAPAIDAAVQRLGPGRPVHDIRMLDEYVADASADTRFALFVLGAFAVLAVVLTAVGVYGVVAYAIARRTREIAVRLALGAAPARIVALVVRDGFAWTAAGLAVGVAGALALSRYLRRCCSASALAIRSPSRWSRAARGRRACGDDRAGAARRAGRPDACPALGVDVIIEVAPSWRGSSVGRAYD